MIPTVLSTKKLARNQKELLLNAGIGFVEANFISIRPLPYNLNFIPQNIIFTSRNAVKIILEAKEKEELQKRKFFCVGQKTAEYLRKNNFEVCATADYGTQLAQKIIEDHSEEEFLFLCGRNRRDELPEELKSVGVQLSEVEVYETQLTPRRFERQFEGVLFFSPSAVESYCSKNELAGSIAFCIGKTTASEARKHTDSIIIASKPSIENVVVQVVKKFVV